MFLVAFVVGKPRLDRAGIDLRAVSRANLGEELARRRRIDQVLARKVAGELAHRNRKLGDLDGRDKPVENGGGIDLMHACVGQQRPSREPRDTPKL